MGIWVILKYVQNYYTYHGNILFDGYLANNSDDIDFSID